MLDKTLESPLDSKEIKPVKPKGNQSWIFTGRTDAEAEALILWPPDAKHKLTGKDHHVRKDWGQEEKGATEDEMIGWHHQLNGHEFEQLWEIVKHKEVWCAAVHGITKSWTRLSDWTDWFGILITTSLEGESYERWLEKQALLLVLGVLSLESCRFRAGVLRLFGGNEERRKESWKERLF